jgi:hypothetical protein
VLVERELRLVVQDIIVLPRLRLHLRNEVHVLDLEDLLLAEAVHRVLEIALIKRQLPLLLGDVLWQIKESAKALPSRRPYSWFFC